MITETPLLSAEEFGLLPDNGQLSELVRGRIVPMNQPYPRHGSLCSNIDFILRDFLRKHDFGKVICNDSGVITERDPDTVRGPDVCFYSYARIPKGSLPKKSYVSVTPELAFEVRSPSDRMSQILAKVSEYLQANVLIVCVLDDESETLTVYTQDATPRILGKNDELTLPEVLPGFSVRVSEFLE